MPSTRSKFPAPTTTDHNGRAAQSRQIDIVLVWKLDRFVRSLRNLLTVIQDFQVLDVDFVSLKDNIDLTTPSGRLMYHLLASFAEFEASRIRERVMAGLREARGKGVRLGRPTEINKGKVLELRAKGKSFSQIATELVFPKPVSSRSQIPGRHHLAD